MQFQASKLLCLPTILQKMSTWTTSESAGWSKIGLSQAYNDVERLSGPLAMELVNRVDALRSLDSTETHAFDNGCGIGVVTSLLKNKFPDVHITATDASPGMIDVVIAHMKSAGWKDVKAAVADSRNLPELPDNEFTHTFSTFMICLAPEPDRIAQEMYRVTAPGGVLGLGVFSVWACGQTHGLAIPQIYGPKPASG